MKIGIGTDTYPHNMIEEMRHALYASRIVAKNVFDLRTSDIFNAATLGGASGAAAATTSAGSRPAPRPTW